MRPAVVHVTIMHYYRVKHSNHYMRYKYIYNQMLCINIILFTLHVSGTIPIIRVIMNHTYITAEKFYTSPLYKGVDKTNDT
jgi:hypothetical protein